MDSWRPIESAQIPLTCGQFAVVDAADLPLLGKGKWQAHPRRDGNGYYAVNSAGVRMHRLLLGVTDARIVDHIDGDGLNNRRANIRVGTQSLNSVNRRTTPGKHLRGVRQKGNKYRAQIKIAGRIVSLGYYATEEQAHAAYMARAQQEYGDWMPLPPPPKQGEG